MREIETTNGLTIIVDDTGLMMDGVLGELDYEAARQLASALSEAFTEPDWDVEVPITKGKAFRLPCGGEAHLSADGDTMQLHYGDAVRAALPKEAEVEKT